MRTTGAIFVVFCVIFLAVETAEVPKNESKTCEPGLYGNPCKKCECGDRATACDYTSGKCFCNSKGTTGDKCDQCDEKKRYKGDALKDGCFFDIDESIKYNFKFVNPQNANFTRVNFKLAPEDKTENIHLKIACIEHCSDFEVKMIARENGKAEKTIVEHQKLNNKTAFEKVFLAKDYKFGMEKEKPQTTFHIHMFHFKTPIVFEITAVPESKLKEKISMTLNES
jgi:hypothetical protein